MKNFKKKLWCLIYKLCPLQLFFLPFLWGGRSLSLSLFPSFSLSSSPSPTSFFPHKLSDGMFASPHPAMGSTVPPSTLSLTNIPGCNNWDCCLTQPGSLCVPSRPRAGGLRHKGIMDPGNPLSNSLSAGIPHNTLYSRQVFLPTDFRAVADNHFRLSHERVSSAIVSPTYRSFPAMVLLRLHAFLGLWSSFDFVISVSCLFRLWVLSLGYCPGSCSFGWWDREQPEPVVYLSASPMGKKPTKAYPKVLQVLSNFRQWTGKWKKLQHVSRRHLG